jgi:hypothetical protein
MPHITQDTQTATIGPDLASKVFTPSMRELSDAELELAAVGNSPTLDGPWPIPSALPCSHATLSELTCALQSQWMTSPTTRAINHMKSRSARRQTAAFGSAAQVFA